jgi:hypothetical protein
MPNDRAPLVIMTVVMAALGLGLAIAFRSTVPPDEPPPTPTPLQMATPAPLADVSLLVVGVDSLASPNPALDSLTVVRFHVDFAQYYLLSVSPDMLINPSSPDPDKRSLRSVYGMDAQYTRGAVFTTDVLQRATPGLGNLYPEIDFDRRALTDTLRLLGSVEFRGEKLDGAAWQKRFNALPPKASLERLRFQNELVQALFLAAQKQNWDLSRLMSTLGRRFYPDLTTALGVLNQTAPPLAGAEFRAAGAPLVPQATPTP